MLSTRNVMPNTIFFVWVGGKMMPDGKMAVVTEWARRNPKYEVIVWVDSTSSDQEDIKKFASELASLASNIHVKDINDEGLNDKYVAYDVMRTPQTNYGGSSDNLRYALGYRFGGLYVDPDVYPGEPLPLNIKINNDGGVLFPPSTQGVETIGNDTIMFVKGSPFAREMAEKARAGYDLTFDQWLDRNDLTISMLEGVRESYDILYHQDDMQTKKMLTLDRTGPAFVRRFLAGKKVIETKLIDGLVPANPAALIYKDTHFSITKDYLVDQRHFRVESLKGTGADPDVSAGAKDQKNTLGWLKPGYRKEDYKTQLLLAIKAMHFEIEHMGILRLNEHVASVLCAKDAPPAVSAKDVIDNMLKSIGESQLSNIKAVQLVPYARHELLQSIAASVTISRQASHLHMRALIELVRYNKLGGIPAGDMQFYMDDKSVVDMFDAIIGVDNIALQHLMKERECQHDVFDLLAELLKKQPFMFKAFENIFNRMTDANQALAFGYFITKKRLAKNGVSFINLIHAYNNKLNGQPISNENKIKYMRAYVSKIFKSNNTTFPALVALLSDMLTGEKDKYSVLRLATGSFSGAVQGNTADWDAMVQELKVAVLERAEKQSEQQPIYLEKSKLDELSELMAARSNRAFSPYNLFTDANAKYVERCNTLLRQGKLVASDEKEIKSKKNKK